MYIVCQKQRKLFSSLFIECASKTILASRWASGCLGACLGNLISVCIPLDDHLRSNPPVVSVRHTYAYMNANVYALASMFEMFLEFLEKFHLFVVLSVRPLFHILQHSVPNGLAKQLFYGITYCFRLIL